MKSGATGVRWVDIPEVNDDRGALTSVESAIDIPFEIKRIFYIHRVIQDRGGHAHIDTDQLVIPVSGSHVIEVVDPSFNKRYLLDEPNKGLYLPRMTFVNLIEFSSDAVSLVLSSTHYDKSMSIRTLDDFLSKLDA